MLCGSNCSLSVPRGALVLSTVCNCDISWSYTLYKWVYKLITLGLHQNKVCSYVFNFLVRFKVTAHSNNRNSKSSREVILGSVRL